MLIDFPIATPASLFLFAHQDDEFAIFPQIEACIRANQSVFCVYVTDGSATADTARRNGESLTVLGAMGVPTHNVFFIGNELNVPDGSLHEKTVDVARWLDAFLDTHSEIVACYVPAWEGGHPDHDLLHAIVVFLMQSRGRVGDVFQFSLYNGYGCPAPFFRVFLPLSENGLVETFQIPWRDRLRYLRYCLTYSSQWRTWVGLFPFVCLHYLFSGVQSLQPVNLKRLTEPPHPGRLYYESRGFFSWKKMKEVLATLLCDKNKNGE